MPHAVDEKTMLPADPDASWMHSRRMLLKGAIGAALVSSGSRASRLAAAPNDPKIDKIARKALGIDLHNHYFYEFSKDPEHRKPDPENELAASIQESGLSAVIYNYCVDDVSGSGGGVGSPPPPNAYYQWHIQSLDYLDRVLAKQNMRRALNTTDLVRSKSRNQPTVIQGSEGCQWIEGKLERIGEAYGRGLRHAQLLHRAPDLVAPLGDAQLDGSPILGGLTSFGVQVVRECNRLGIVVDLAHGTEKTVIAATRVTRQPLVVSHTALASQKALATIPPLAEGPTGEPRPCEGHRRYRWHYRGLAPFPNNERLCGWNPRDGRCCRGRSCRNGFR
ncbi:hypothetical protein EWE75_22160 [Sphingomonas populi]|uniref:Peptidase M19 n=1 Tax=Sphingomonas populi TaxID=2484750 RepID=A0A4Q6XVB2_9SPHN|nr:membrane dipeptidase [Sphingomonas populi]RZF60607.1 hypothetical protein EWE75_22160 [Sphingomonas populi]